MAQMGRPKFVAGDDDSFEQGDRQIFDLTDAEAAALNESVGEPVRIDRRSGLFPAGRRRLTRRRGRVSAHCDA